CEQGFVVLLIPFPRLRFRCAFVTRRVRGDPLYVVATLVDLRAANPAASQAFGLRVNDAPRVLFRWLSFRYCHGKPSFSLITTCALAICFISAIETESRRHQPQCRRQFQSPRASSSFLAMITRHKGRLHAIAASPVV